MANLFRDGFEHNSSSSTPWDVNTGSPVVNTTAARSGTYGLDIKTLVSATRMGMLFTFVSVADSNARWFRFYLNIQTLPSAENQIWCLSNGTFANSHRASITLDSGGLLRLYNGSSATQVGSASSALSTNTWYRIEVHSDGTGGAGASSLDARIDGVQFAGATNLTLNGTSKGMGVGGNLNVEAQTQGEWWFDDIAINDSTGASQTSFSGSGKVIRLKPNAAGDVNTFATQTGGTAGSANNFTRVNEVTPDSASTFNGSNTLNQEDLFNVDNSGIGASDTVNVVSVGALFRNNVADATTAIKFEIEKTGSGTKTQSSAIVPNATAFKFNATATPNIDPIITYKDPDNNPWTQTTLDSMQIGYLLSTGGTNRIDVSTVWATVDYTPAAGGATTPGTPNTSFLPILGVG